MIIRGKVFSVVALVLLLTSALTLAFNIQPAGASGTIYIRADGSIDPPTAPISTVDNITYTLIGNITSDGDGIIVQKNGVTIDGAGCTIEGTGAYPSMGIFLIGISNVVIRNMQIKRFYNGVSLYYSSGNNSVSGNNITANSGAGVYLFHSSSGNNVSGNNITNHQLGVYFEISSGNSVSGNNIANNNYGVVASESSSSNRIYHNNFVDNTQQAIIYGLTNIWDDGYPSGGNYWSAYSGSDLYLGEFQTEPGSDGIGDTSYVIDGNNTDHYPLMSPWTPPDVAVLNVTSAKRIIGEGYSAYLTALVENQGSKVENLNTTVYVGQANVTFQTFLLKSHNSLVHTFSWNSAGFSKGNYTLSACIEPVEGEEDIADNTMYNGWVFITIQGDVDGDRYVNFKDAILLGAAFGSTPGFPNWNPNADVNCDGTVNFIDAILLGSNFGQSWT